MKPIKDLFGEYKIPPKSRITERGELLRFFANELNKHVKKDGKMFNESRVAFFVAHLTVKDLYFLKSECEQAEKRGYSFFGIFWHSIKVKFHKKDFPNKKNHLASSE